MAVSSSGSCAELTARAGEPLAGTAPEDGGTLFLVRYRGAWPKYAIEESSLPAALKDGLAAAARATSGRALLVRGPVREPDPPELFVVRTAPGERFALRFRCSSYEAMAELDLAEIAARGEHGAAERLVEPIFLVCTHGKRDRCCAARGTEAFRAIEGMRPGRVFQSSHLGGHRFAANVLSLPDGFCYGRVGPEEARAWVEATEKGQLFDLRRVRGRVGFPAPVQAAELFVRSAISETGVDAISLEAAHALPDGGHRAVFRAGEATHEVVVTEDVMETSRPTGCGREPEPARRYILREHRVGVVGRPEP